MIPTRMTAGMIGKALDRSQDAQDTPPRRQT